MGNTTFWWCFLSVLDGSHIPQKLLLFLMFITNSETPPSESNFAPVIIITGSMAVLIIGVLVVSISLRFLRPPRVLTDEDIQHFLDGTPAESGESTHSLDNISVDELRGDNNIYEDLLQLPYNKEFEFPRSNFTYDKKSCKLGEGAFGSVYPGKLKVFGNEECDVAIKMITGNVTRDKLKSILAEIKIMSYVGSHTNVVNLKVAHTRQLNQNKILMAVELCSGGSLEDFITANKYDFDRKPVHGYDSWGPNFTTSTLLKWAQDIADGMSFLSSKKVIHVDLATRNIFLTDTLIPKIGDFGLSRRLYTKEIYLKKSEGYLPICWMSLESLKTLTFSTQSDIWSYGVTLWEMFALTWDQLEMFLDSGRRLLQPQHASLDIYAIMLQCWDTNPSLRPSFDVLKYFFLDAVEKLDRSAIDKIEVSAIHD